MEAEQAKGAERERGCFHWNCTRHQKAKGGWTAGAYGTGRELWGQGGLHELQRVGASSEGQESEDAGFRSSFISDILGKCWLLWSESPS